MYWFNLFLQKLIWIPRRIWDWLRWLPKRLMRIGTHVYIGVQPGRYNWWPKGQRPGFGIRVAFWYLELLLLVLDALGVMEVYETLIDAVKFPTRPLSMAERLEAKKVFGEALDYLRIRLDEFAVIGPSWANLAYVSGFHVNYWRSITPAILLHELTHVWQYQQVGLVYIPRALWAQHSPEGYDYGGPERIWERIQSGGLLNDFNYEQQAEIVADYYRILAGQQAEYHYGINAQPALYAGILGELHSPENYDRHTA